MRIYDLIIIGVGSAGITAGIYAKNFGLDCLIIGQEVGGLINAAYKVENYPGFFNISGKELSKKFKAHQKYLKVPLKKERIEKISPVIRLGKVGFKVSARKNYYYSKSLILAFGTETKKLDIKNIEKFESKGINYRVGDNAFLFKNKVVAIIGGANAAVMSAVSLAKVAKKVYLIYRREKLRANAMWMERVKKLKNVEIIYKANVADLKGKNRLEKIVLDNKKQLKINGLVIETGGVPNTFLIHDLGIKTDKNGYIKTDKTQATNVKGIFAAGDATTGSNEFRQIITACSEAAVAVLGVFNYLSK
jgi:thioredoxin reductase (NADPH)